MSETLKKMNAFYDGLKWLHKPENTMIYINIFEVVGDAGKHTAAYSWPQSPLPKGRIIGRQGNALLLELPEGGFAVISAPAADLRFMPQEGVPIVDLSWAF